MKHSSSIILICILCATAVLAGLGCNNTNQKGADSVASPVPTVSIESQSITNQQITVEQAYAFEPSWIVIHADNHGEPGEVVGYAHVDQGESRDVPVKLDTKKTTPIMYAVLHRDSGQIGTFEFPGADEITTYLENPVFRQFSLQTKPTL